MCYLEHSVLLMGIFRGGHLDVFPEAARICPGDLLYAMSQNEKAIANIQEAKEASDSYKIEKWWQWHMGNEHWTEEPPLHQTSGTRAGKEKSQTLFLFLTCF